MNEARECAKTISPSWIGRPPLRWLLAIGVLALLGPSSAAAQFDTDNDLVPDAFDNCSDDPNGPNEGSNQVDSDVDGYGNVCDPDYDNDFVILTSDYATLLSDLTGPGLETDHDGNGIVTVADFAAFLRRYGQSPGPSGLACAGTDGCLP